MSSQIQGCSNKDPRYSEGTSIGLFSSRLLMCMQCNGTRIVMFWTVDIRLKRANGEFLCVYRIEYDRWYGPTNELDLGCGG